MTQLHPEGFSDFVVHVGEEKESETYGFWAELRHVKKGAIMLDHGQTRIEAVSALYAQLRRLASAVRILQ